MPAELRDSIRNDDIHPTIGYEIVLDNRDPEHLRLYGTCTGADGKPLGNSPVALAKLDDPGPSDGLPNFLASRFLRLTTLLENMTDFLNQGGSLEELTSAANTLQQFHQGAISFPGYQFFGTCEEIDTNQPGIVFMREDGKKAIVIYRNSYVDGPAPVEEIIDATNVTSSSDQTALRLIAGL